MHNEVCNKCKDAAIGLNDNNTWQNKPQFQRLSYIQLIYTVYI